MTTEIKFITKDGKEMSLEKAAALSAADIKQTFDVKNQMELARAIRLGKKASPQPVMRRAPRKAIKATKAKEEKKPRKVAKKEEKSKEKGSPEGKGSSKSDHCRVCGKPLSRETSVIQGMGPDCADRLGVTVSTPAAEVEGKVTTYLEMRQKKLAALTVGEVDDNFITLEEGWQAIKKTKVSRYAFMRSVGGNGAVHPPLNKHFQLTFCKGKRYLPKSFLEHAGDLKKAQEGKL